MGKIILIVLLGIGAFGLLIGGIACALLPKDAVEITVTPDVNVLVNKDLMGSEWSNIDETVVEGNSYMAEAAPHVQLEKANDGLLVRVQGDAIMDRTYGVRDALRGIAAGLIVVASAIVTMVMFLKLCKAFEACRTPFDEPVIARMNIFAWTLIVCAAVGAVAGGATSALFTGFRNMNFSLNLTPIFAALIVFFLCMVFRYGAQLQKEADETL